MSLYNKTLKSFALVFLKFTLSITTNQSMVKHLNLKSKSTRIKCTFTNEMMHECSLRNKTFWFLKDWEMAWPDSWDKLMENIFLRLLSAFMLVKQIDQKKKKFLSHFNFLDVFVCLLVINKILLFYWVTQEVNNKHNTQLNWFKYNINDFVYITSHCSINIKLLSSFKEMWEGGAACNVLTIIKGVALASLKVADIT